jgi:hypothetical protein
MEPHPGVFCSTVKTVIALADHAGSRVVRVWGSATKYDSAPAMSPAIPSVYM